MKRVEQFCHGVLAANRSGWDFIVACRTGYGFSTGGVDYSILASDTKNFDPAECKKLFGGATNKCVMGGGGNHDVSLEWIHQIKQSKE